MTPLETEANPNIRVGPLRWGRPVFNGCRYSMEEVIDGIKQSVLQGDETKWSAKDNFKRDLRCFRGPLGDSLCVVSPQPGDDESKVEVQLRYDRYERSEMVFN